jgi:hypothetical protein
VSEFAATVPRGRLPLDGDDKRAGPSKLLLTIVIMNYDPPMQVAPADHHVVNLGRRIELVSMDRWLPDITIALYRRDDPPRAIVHSYSGKAGVAGRLAWLAEAMGTLAGLEVDAAAREVWFSCGAWHELALRRTFLEANKVDPSLQLEPRPMAVDDPRSTQHIEVESIGDGAYKVVATSVAEGETNRAPAIAAGLAKLLELQTDLEDPTSVRFGCGSSHDDLVGLLLIRAINVRATLRELEAAATRGILVAPSAQEAAPP